MIMRIGIIQGFCIEGIDSSIRIELVYNKREIIFYFKKFVVFLVDLVTFEFIPEKEYQEFP